MVTNARTANASTSAGLPETVNYHFTSACNMRCRFCFAGFKDCGFSTLEKHKSVIRAIAAAPSDTGISRRLNFVGGEPTAYPYLDNLLREAAACGLRTSIVTNGFNLARFGLPKSFQSLELIGVSIDSLDAGTNRRMGRSVRGETLASQD